MTAEWDSEEYEGDLAEPVPDTIGTASRTAKCHHCEGRIYEDKTHEWGWLHEDNDDPRCPDMADYMLDQADRQIP